MPGGTNATGGFSFGQSQTPAMQQNTANKGLFGTPAATNTLGGFNFGTGATQQATGGTSLGVGGFTAGASSGGFSLGQQQQQQQQPPPAAATSTLAVAPTAAPASAPVGGGGGGGGFSFGAAAAPAASTTSGFNFGMTPSTSVATSVGGGFLGGSTLTPASTAAAAAAATTTGFSFGTPAPLTAATTTATAAAAATPTLFGLGAATTSAPSLGFNRGMGLPATTTAAAAAAPAVSTIAAAPATAMGLGGMGMGLGGTQPPSASTDANSSGSKTSGKSTKDQQLSQDLFGTIAVFESRKNAENSASEENIRQTAAPFHKIRDKAKEVQKVLAELASEYLQLQANTSNLKGEVMKEAEHVEMAKRTKETPMALQGDNKAPEVFFINLVRSFEAEMMYCRTKIEEVAQCMQAASNPCETEEDIAEVLQREHDTLKDLAAKVYAKHSQLVELSQALNTKATPNEQEFFRPRAKENTKTPASAVVRPVLGGGGSGLLAFQEQQQRAKAVTLGAAPPTMPLANTTTPSMFSGGSNPTCIFSSGTSFGGSGFGLGTGLSGVGNTNTPFGTKPLFGNPSTNFGGANTQPGLSQNTTLTPFTINSPFNTKPFGS